METERTTIALDATLSLITETDAVRMYRAGESMVKFSKQSAYLVKEGEVFV